MSAAITCPTQQRKPSAARLCLRFLLPVSLRGDHSDELDPVAGVRESGEFKLMGKVVL